MRDNYGTGAANAQAVLDDLDSRGIQRAVLVGHSYGGGVALSAASLAPHRVEAVVLLASIGPRCVNRWDRLLAAPSLATARSGSGGWSTRLAVPRSSGLDHISPTYMSRCVPGASGRGMVRHSGAVPAADVAPDLPVDVLVRLQRAAAPPSIRASRARAIHGVSRHAASAQAAPRPVTKEITAGRPSSIGRYSAASNRPLGVSRAPNTPVSMTTGPREPRFMRS